MNLRVFKKDIEYFVAEFIDDCALFVALNPHKDSDEIAQIIDEAVELYNDPSTVRAIQRETRRLSTTLLQRRCSRSSTSSARSSAQWFQSSKAYPQKQTPVPE